MFGIQPVFAGKTAVVGGDFGLGESSVLHPLGKVLGNTLGHATGIDKDQRGAVFGDQVCQAVVHLAPDLRRHDRLQRRAWQFDGQVPLPYKTGVDDPAVGRTVAVTEQERRHAVDGFLGG